jgi:copper chaperone CopZ
MSEQRIKELINELIKELENTDGIAAEAVSVAKQLEGKIDDLVNPEVDSSENTILDDAIALEASFAASHPVAEKLIRELIITLSRIGI